MALILQFAGRKQVTAVSASKAVRLFVRYASESKELAQKRKRLIILGTGWAGFRVLRDIDINLYDVAVVSPRNHFLFTPLLTSTCVGTLEFRGVIEPVRTARERINYVQAECVGIDTEKQLVHCESIYPTNPDNGGDPYKPSFSMWFDELVVAVGAAPNTFGVPGVEKYCFFLKQLTDARNIRQRILECFERASNPTIDPVERRRLLHFVVVGGGPTSVEFTAEVHDFLRQDVHRWFPELENDVRVTLVEAGDRLLSTFDATLSEYTMKKFRERKIDVRTGVSVKEVRRHEMVLSDGWVMPFGIGVWSTGVAPIPLVQKLPFRKERGRLLIDEYLNVVEPPFKNIYGLGDCAGFAKDPLPATAQAAEQMGKYAARVLNAKAKGLAVEPFRYQNRGMLAYIGGHEALADLPIIHKSGFFAWLFWNAAYLTQLVSLRNRIMIPMYWLKSYLFGRDISRF